MESHRRAIRQVIIDRRDSAIIFEDDIDLDENFEDIVTDVMKTLPADWKIVMFGKFSLLYKGHCGEKKGRLISNITVDDRITCNYKNNNAPSSNV
jgi:GR25 family glycosyltransferase involved in LPS biosynthesis